MNSSDNTNLKRFISVHGCALKGPKGEQGLTGLNGQIGLTGPTGENGEQGIQGIQGLAGLNGQIGPTGPTGPTGEKGEQGIQGDISTLSFASFYALMPSDNTATIAVGASVAFPNNGIAIGIDITRVSTTHFTVLAGTYQVFFQVSINEPGQLAIAVNDDILPYTVVGRATGTSQLVGMSFVTITSGSISIMNPNSTALTVTPIAGGAYAVSANLNIIRIA